MWDRKELKERGKAAFRANRITCIFAAFLLSLAGGAPAFTSTTTVNRNQEELNIPPEMMRIIITAIGVIAVLAFLLSIFVFNPARVGLKKFFYDNSFDAKAGLSKENLGVGFSNGNYTNVVAAMFTTDIFKLLWAMLFIIPGIYKALCWRMVPFIIAEDPEISGTEARIISTEMMYGSKWASFVLDLSFLGWEMLGVMTLGIVNLIWTNPYTAATEAELYRTLKARSATAEYAEAE